MLWSIIIHSWDYKLNIMCIIFVVSLREGLNHNLVYLGGGGGGGTDDF